MENVIRTLPVQIDLHSSIEQYGIAIILTIQQPLKDICTVQTYKKNLEKKDAPIKTLRKSVDITDYWKTSNPQSLMSLYIMINRTYEAKMEGDASASQMGATRPIIRRFKSIAIEYNTCNAQGTQTNGNNTQQYVH